MSKIYISLKHLLNDFLNSLGYVEYYIVPNKRGSKVLTVWWQYFSLEPRDFENRFVNQTIYYGNRKLTFFKLGDNKYSCNIQPIDKYSKYKLGY